MVTTRKLRWADSAKSISFSNEGILKRAGILKVGWESAGGVFVCVCVCLAKSSGFCYSPVTSEGGRTGVNGGYLFSKVKGMTEIRLKTNENTQGRIQTLQNVQRH